MLSKAVSNYADADLVARVREHPDPRRGSSLYSNEGENRAAWPLLFSIASSLADELGAIPEEDAPPRSDHIPMFIEPNEPKPN